ncbi:MAG TPA: transcription termination/antitermination protein NusA [Tenericutes bacterium]|nr:transcription termination/antitermination protein NusA [Mycoplasmatota bacterium]
MKADEFLKALEEVAEEKKIDKEYILSAMVLALTSAYKKNFVQATNVRVDINSETGEIKVFAQYIVVEKVENKLTEISLEEAQKINPKLNLGDIYEKEVTPADFGRVAAQTAKQVIIQKIKEAERESITQEFIDQEGELVTGTVNRKDNVNYYVNLGRTDAILPRSETINNEEFPTGKRIKVYLFKVEPTSKGVLLLLSRSHFGFVRRLFEREVPEIFDGTVELKAIARDAGSRTKIAVLSNKDGVDPVGTCIGPKGERINAILKELNGEKIDVVEWDKDPKVFIANALKPATVLSVDILDEKEKQALVIVSDDQLSLAIGKKGQNARLASRLTSYRIDIKTENEAEKQEENE